MPDAAYARFVFDDSVIRADGSVRWRAFLDKRPPHETSVNEHAALGCGIHWNEGDRVNANRALAGAADITRGVIESTGLKVRSAPIASLPHHAEIFGWPQGDTDDTKHQCIDLATDLADAAIYVARGGAR